MSAKDTVVATKEVPAPPRQSRFSLRAPRDPGFAALRRAARAAIVIPLAFALGTFVLHLGQNVIFIVFGCFALLVITDFGGLRPARARAYLTATAVGAGLVALGSFVSLTIAAAAAVTFVVALVISFARVFGGYFVAGQTGMLLAYIVATAVPAPSSSIPTRVGAFALAGVISTLAGVFMWPRFERVTLCKQAAKACLRMADLVEALNAGGDATELQRWIDAARAAEQAARREYVATAKRPAGPARRDRALAQLLIELQRIVDIVEHPFYQYRASVVPRIAERDRLAASTVAALRASADVLTGGTPPDLRAVEDTRLAHRAALDRWAGEELKAGRPADQVLDGLDVDHTLRVIAYLTIALGSNAIITAGGRPEVNVGRSVSASGGLGGVMPSRSRDDPHAPRPLFHGGPIESARGYRPGHCRGAGESPGTTARILVLGVVLGGLFALVAGTNSVLLWSVLPFAIFLAAYASTAIGFAAGQAAFSLLLIIMFNLIVPTGWQIGVVRIEDLLVGVAISVVVGVLLWPRGVRRALAHAIARFYRAISAYLDRSFDHILGLTRPGDADPLRRVALQAGDLAGEAFDDFVNEKAVSPLSPDRAGFLLSAGNHAILAADLLEWLAGMGYQASTCAEGARAVETQVLILLASLVQLADRLALVHAAERHDDVSVDRLRAAAVDCLRRWRNDESAGRGAMAVVMAGEWTQNVARLVADLEQPVNAAVEAARLPWWR
ncbi:MAG: hypothetical protein E6I68_11135 [Chloroflexi bacterium]|nr:MAG: hypothetical protein E6I68_11135 [Chloroflexota bacterium]